MTKFTEFFGDETGAITIDWIVITSAIALLGIVVLYAIFNGGLSGLVPGFNETLAGEPANVVIGTIEVQ